MDTAAPLRHRLCAAALAVLAAAALTAPRLATPALRHWDEAWYAQASRETAASGTPLTVRWNGRPWFHKPPLALWLTGLAFGALGEGELAARLPAWLCGLATVGLVAWHAGRWGPRWALAGGLLLASIPEFCRYATCGQLDAPLTLLTTATLLAFWHARGRPALWPLAGLCFGLAVMTKGAAAGLAAVVAGGHLALAGEWRLLRRPGPWCGVLVAAAVCVPWHVHQVATHGEPFVRDYFSRHLGQLLFAVTPETAASTARPTYYAEFLLEKFRPWGWATLALSACGLSLALRGGDPHRRLLGCWAALMPLALSCAEAKFSWYLVPAYPGVALLATDLLRRHGRWWWAVPLALACGVQGLTRIPNELNEQHLRALAPALRRGVPPGDPVHVLQAGRPRQAVYPIATAWYARRAVHTHASVAALADVARAGGRPFVLVTHRSHLPALRDAFAGDGRPLARSGPLAAMRWIP